MKNRVRRGLAAMLAAVLMAAALPASFAAYAAEAEASGTGQNGVYLTDMEPFSDTHDVWVNHLLHASDNYGNEYSRTLGPVDDGGLEYNIEGKWRSLSGQLFVSKGASQDLDPDTISWKRAMICIYGDDHKLYEHTGFTYKDKPLDFEVDVTGVEFLRIEFTCANYSDNPIFIVADPLLSQKPAASPNTAADTVPLTSLEPFGKPYGMPCDQIYYSSDNFGGAYTFNIAPDETESAAEYYLDGNYTKLSGCLYVIGTAAMDLERDNDCYYNAYIAFYADDVKVWEYSGFSYNMKPVPFEIDLTGVEFLRIEARDSIYYDTGMSTAMMAIGNPMLHK